MTRLFRITLAVCAVCASAAGCAGFTRHAEAVPEADKVAVYESEPPHHRPYSLVKSLWVTSWVSVGVVPGYRSVEDGTIDFRNQAVALGGNAIKNFNCYRLDPAIPLESQPKLICNGDVIKYLQ